MRKYLLALILSVALLTPGCSTMKAMSKIGPRAYIATTITAIHTLESRLFMLQIPFAFAIDTAFLPLTIPYEIYSLIKEYVEEDTIR
jgi:uncharacterized protein YceK